jgi:hypothetical protein
MGPDSKHPATSKHCPRCFAFEQGLVEVAGFFASLRMTIALFDVGT